MTLSFHDQSSVLNHIQECFKIQLPSSDIELIDRLFLTIMIINKQSKAIAKYVTAQKTINNTVLIRMKNPLSRLVV